MKYKIAIIGSPDAISGFKAVGCEAIGVKTKEEAREKIQQIYDSSDYAVLFITENWADNVREFLNELPPKALPSITAIPSQLGSTGAGLANLKRIVEQAVGSDILSGT